MKADDAKRLKEVEADSGGPGAGYRHVEGAEPGNFLSPNRRRQAVSHLQERFGVCELRAGAVAGRARSTQRLAPPQPTDDELALRAWLRDFARRRPRPACRGERRSGRPGWAVSDPAGKGSSPSSWQLTPRLPSALAGAVVCDRVARCSRWDLHGRRHEALADRWGFCGSR